MPAADERAFAATAKGGADAAAPLPRRLEPVVVSTPGKLILMGEHAAVYGRPALVAAIDLRLTARFSTPARREVGGGAGSGGGDGGGATSGEPRVMLDLPRLGLREEIAWSAVRRYAEGARAAWGEFSRRLDAASFARLCGGDPAHLVKVALGEAAAAIDGEEEKERGGEGGLGGEGGRGGVRGEEEEGGQGGARGRGGEGGERGRSGESGEGAGTDWDLELVIDSELPVGSGFGSSAAAAVAIVAGLCAWRGRPLPAGEIERLALEVERRQHGLPSGIDTATTLHGGLLWARRLPGGALEVERLPARSPVLGRLRVYDTGTPPEPTGVVVAAVRERQGLDPVGHARLFDRMAEAARGLRRELAREEEEPGTVVELLREHEACQEELGVVPAPVRQLVREVEAAGGAAKISGAGSLAGPGGGSLLIYHQEPERIAGLGVLAGLRHHPVELGAPGLRLEREETATR